MPHRGGSVYTVSKGRFTGVKMQWYVAYSSAYIISRLTHSRNYCECKIRPKKVIHKYTTDILFCKQPSLPQAIIAYLTKQGRGAKVEDELSSSTVDALCTLFDPDKLLAGFEGMLIVYNVLSN